MSDATINEIARQIRRIIKTQVQKETSQMPKEKKLAAIQTRLDQLEAGQTVLAESLKLMAEGLTRMITDAKEEGDNV